MAPRAPKAQLDSTSVEIAQPSDIILPGLENSGAQFDDIYTPPPVEIEIAAAPSNGGGDSQHFEELKFMEEFVEVMVHESTDENAENPVFTACNGVTQYFFRGQVQRVKRKYVYILASTKEGSISTPEFTAKDGSRATAIKQVASLKYPFSVISDPNPRGPAWLKTVLGSRT